MLSPLCLSVIRQLETANREPRTANYLIREPRTANYLIREPRTANSELPTT
jgi:hypothetical protein